MSKPTDKSEAEFWCGGFAEQQPEQKINVFSPLLLPWIHKHSLSGVGKGKTPPKQALGPELQVPRDAL